MREILRIIRIKASHVRLALILHRSIRHTLTHSIFDGKPDNEFLPEVLMIQLRDKESGNVMGAITEDDL